MPAEDFFVEPEVYAHTAETAAKGEKAEKEWEEMFAAYAEKYPELAAEWKSWHSEELPVDLLNDEDFWKFEGSMATRASSGEVLNRLPLIEAPADEWVYTVSLTDPEGTDAEWNSLLSHLTSRKEALAALRESCSVTLRLYVQSDYAQIAYCLSPETMGKLVALGMPLSISSLSWGEVAI